MQGLIEKNAFFKKSSCIFLGYLIDKHGYHVTEDKIRAIKEFRHPATQAEARSFLGLMNFVDKFIPNRADHTHHLQGMLREKQFYWNQELQEEFDFMRNEALKSIRTLGFFDPSHETNLYVDASPVGLGAILSQSDLAGIKRIIACASKSLTETEKRYPQTQKEALSVVWAAERFRFYLLGIKFTIWTDGEANEYLFNEGHRLGKRSITRAEAWTLRLLPFDFTIKRVKGSENIADACSRLISESQNNDQFDPCYSDHILFITDDSLSNLTYEEIAEYSASDPTLLKVRAALGNNLWSDELKPYHAVKRELFVVGDVIIFRNKYIVPSVLRDRALKMAHRGHFGMSSMKRNIRRSLWWPGVNKDIEKKVSNCETCIRITPNHPEPLSSRTLPEEPMEVIQIDFLYIPDCGTEEFLMITDTFSRMFWIVEMKRTDSQSTSGALRDIFTIWGRPRLIMSDNGPPFNSQSFKDYWNSEGVSHLNVIPFSPQMNGMVERRNQGVIRTLKAAKLDGIDWRGALSHYVNTYNHEVPHSVTGATPFELLTGRKFRGFFPSMFGSTRHKLDRDDIVESDASAKLRSSTYTDGKRGAKSSDIREGDWVTLSNKHMKDKLDAPFTRDRFQVLTRCGAKVIVRNSDGVQYTRSIFDIKLLPPEVRWKQLSPNPISDIAPTITDLQPSSPDSVKKNTNPRVIKRNPLRTKTAPKRLSGFLLGSLQTDSHQLDPRLLRRRNKAEIFENFKLYNVID